jgi:ParB family chromosome partitioning protein
VNAIKTKTDYDGNARFAHADALATALGMDMTRWFTPTAENFFDRISKAKILEALAEAGKEAGPIKRGMKKGELAKAAEFDLAGSDWLPQPLRISPERMGTVADTGVEDDTEQDIEGGGGDK